MHGILSDLVGSHCKILVEALDLCSLAQDKYDLHLPEYPGAAQCVRIGGAGTQQNGGQQNGKPGDVAAMRISYDRGGLTEDQADPDPYKQFDR